MSEQETHEEIIAEMRIFKCRNLETGELELCNAIANYFADRLVAAYKRELEAKESVIQTLAAELQAERERAKNNAPGNAAKLREALEQAKTAIIVALKKMSVENPIILEIIDAALAAPPRNCDIHTDFNDAIRTLADERNWHDGKWDSERYCILASWLLAPATEKEGGTDGNE